MSIEPYAQLEGDKRQDLKVCPISQLVEISTPFAGIDVDELKDNPRFCRFEREELQSPFRNNDRGIRFRDRTLNQCEVNHNIISERISLIEEVFSFNEIPSFDEINKMEISEEKKLELAGNIGKEMGKIASAKKFLREWREILYDLVGNEDGERNNHHFSGYKYEELTDEVVLDEVKKFNSALEREMLGYEQKETCHSDFHGYGVIFKALRRSLGN
jgi:hypothetical protein